MKTLLAIAATAILFAAPARADDQSYLAYLTSHGTNTTQFPYSPAQFVQAGHFMCTNLQAGADPFAGASFVDRAILGPSALEAAQHELCPNTLR